MESLVLVFNALLLHARVPGESPTWHVEPGEGNGDREEAEFDYHLLFLL